MADLKFVPHTSPAEAERQLLIAVAHACLDQVILQSGGLAKAKIEHLEKCLALVDAPRQFACRAHGKPFSSAAPCPGCAGQRAIVGFALVGPENHVVSGGRTACGKAPGPVAYKLDRLQATVGLCRDCYAAVPAAVWDADFTPPSTP